MVPMSFSLSSETRYEAAIVETRPTVGKHSMSMADERSSGSNSRIVICPFVRVAIVAPPRLGVNAGTRLTPINVWWDWPNGDSSAALLDGGGVGALDFRGKG